MSTQWTNDEQTRQRLLHEKQRTQERQQLPVAEKPKQRNFWMWIVGGAVAFVLISNFSVTHFQKGDTSYVNRDGDRISIPGQSSAGATARCRNGSYSRSQHRNGTCSQEGGVAEWLR